MITLKWIKSLTDFGLLKESLYPNSIWDSQNLLIVLMDHLLNILKEFKNLNYVYKNKLDKACFAHYPVLSDISNVSDNEDLAKWNFSDKVLKDRAYNTAISPKHDGYRVGEWGQFIFIDQKTDVSVSMAARWFCLKNSTLNIENRMY